MANELDVLALGEPGAMGQEEEVIELAGQVDEAKDEAYEKAGPSVTATLSGFNALVDGVNAVLPLFKAPPYEMFSEAVPKLPGAFVKVLTMIAEAATSAGLEELAPSIESLTDDKSFKMEAGKLKTLASKSEFKAYIRSAPAPKDAPVEAGMVDDTGAEEAADAEYAAGEDEALMTGRV